MEKMQKLEERDTYTPTSAPQARSSVAGRLNPSVKVGTVLSSLKTSNSDVDNSQHRGSSDLRVQNIVYVLNMRGQPLMPTHQQKASC